MMECNKENRNKLYLNTRNCQEPTKVPLLKRILLTAVWRNENCSRNDEFLEALLLIEIAAAHYVTRYC